MNISEQSSVRSKPKLLTHVRNVMRTSSYSAKTIEAYQHWIKDLIQFNNKVHPKNLNKENVEKYLTYLATKRNVSASTQNQALAALLYLYKNIIGRDIGWLDDIIRAKRSRRLPVVFSKGEVTEIFKYLNGIPLLIVSLLYGAGLRLGEALKLRVKDINFEYKQIIVREAKRSKDRITTLPEKIIPELKTHLNRVYLQHKKDLANGKGRTKLPFA